MAELGLGMLLYIDINSVPIPFIVADLFAAIEKFSYSNMHCRLIQTKGVDAILVFSKPSSPHVTDTLPFFNNMPLIEPQPLLQFQNDPIAVETAAALKAYLVWCHQVLSSHPFNLRRKEEGTNPLNGLVTLRSGQKKAIENFSVRWGLKGLSISSGLLYRGLSNFLGIDSNEAEDSDDPGRDIYDRLMQAEAAKDNYDFIHVHTKTPDEAAHTKNCHKKVETIEALDRGIGKAMASLLSSDTQLVITSDHSTPSSGPLIHSGEPVPITMVGPGIRRDSINRYSEVDCAGGALGYIQGSNLMFMVLNSLDRIKLEGLHDTPVDQYFWPGQRKPFLLL
jgi:2,3-bisphosphoglycerate-independent phosphoglycerate mutase